MLNTGVTLWQPAVYGSSVAAFTPASLYTIGQLGAWYDPSDLTTLYQDSAGTTAVTAVTQPVGKALDKSGRSNHLSQATASARPIYSARVNLLTKSEQIDDAAWTKNATTVAVTSGTAPDGSATTDKVAATAVSGTHYVSRPAVSINGGVAVMSIHAMAAGYSKVGIREGINTGAWGVFDLAARTVAASSGVISAAIEALGAGWYRCSITVATVSALLECYALNSAWVSDSPAAFSFAGNGTDGLYFWGADIRSGVVGRYQRVNTATDYDTVGFPVYDSFDGIDDGLSTGAITLGADMDCFIALRRSSAAMMIFTSNLGGGNYGPLIADGSSNTGTSASMGSPTYAANGVNVAGGTASTRGQLAAAYPIGSWVVLEIRNADFSTWAQLFTSTYAGFVFAGDIAGIILSPAGDAASRTKIRTYLGAKVGLTFAATTAPANAIYDTSGSVITDSSGSPITTS